MWRRARGRGRARGTLLVSHAPFPGVGHCAVGGGGWEKSAGVRPEVLGARWVEPPSSRAGQAPLTKWEEAALGGCGGHCEPSYGAGDAPERLGRVPGARLPLGSWAWRRTEIGK